MNKIRTADDHDRFKLSLVPTDTAFWQSEQRWGVGRLERLVSTDTLQAYRRGWDAYRVALDECDAAAVKEIGPKMIAALAFMDAEATAAGQQPLAPDTWEASMGDGRTLVIVRSNAEVVAVMRTETLARVNGSGETVTAYTARPGFGMTVVSEPAVPLEAQSTETTLPPDLAVTVRNQHEGRQLLVVTMAEIVGLMKLAEAKVLGVKWEGTEAYSGKQMEEGAAADIVRSGHPLSAPIATGLDF